MIATLISELLAELDTQNTEQADRLAELRAQVAVLREIRLKVQQEREARNGNR